MSKQIVHPPRMWIDLSRAQPFDVLLTQGNSLMSRIIRSANSCHFTHAALCTGGCDLIEADIFGTSETRLPSVPIPSKIDGREYLFARLDSTRDALLLRHPSVDSTTAKALLSASHSDSLALCGLHYSKMGRLAAIARPDKVVHRLAIRSFAFAIDCIWPKRRSLQGPFCSELVAQIYKYREIALFNDDRVSAQVSPQDLATSKLEVVSEAIYTEDQMKEILGYVPNVAVYPWMMSPQKTRLHLLLDHRDSLKRKLRDGRHNNDS